jgi:putative polyhydroxyalkanoate system protein
LHENAFGVSVSKITIRRSHSLSPPKALSLAKTLAADIERDYGVRSTWQGDTMHFKGSGASGTLHVAAKEIVLELQLGLMLFALRGSIVAKIERMFDEVLTPDPAKRTKKRS